MKIYDALMAGSEMLEFEKCSGRIAAEYCYAYPPDIPMIVPGEIIDKEMIVKIQNMIKDGLTIIGVENGRFKVVKEEV